MALRSRRSTQPNSRTAAEPTSAKTAPSVVRTTVGAGTPAATAASWNAAASSASSGGGASNGSFTAHAPRLVVRRQIWPCSPRATGPLRRGSVPMSKWSASAAASAVVSIGPPARAATGSRTAA